MEKKAQHQRIGSGPFRLFALFLIITGVAALGTGIRLLGITHGSPQWIYHPDVSKQAGVAREVYNGRKNPIRFSEDDFKRRLYPYGTAVLLGKALRWGEATGLITITPGTFLENDRWLWSLRLRYLSVLVFMLAVALVLGILHRELGPVLTGLTGLLLVMEPLNAQFSHYGTNDVPLLSMLLLVWVCTAGIPEGKRGRWAFSLLGGILLGVGFGIKYQALIGFLFPGVVWLALWKRGLRLAAFSSATVFLSGFLLGAILTSPLLPSQPVQFFLQFQHFMHWQTNIMETDLTGKFSRNLAWLGRFTIQSWLWVFLPGAVWAAHRILRKKERPAVHILMSSALAFVVALTVILVISRDLMRTNDMLFVFPFLIVLSGLMLSRRPLPRPDGKVKVTTAVILIMHAVIIIIFASQSLRDSLAFTREDTRERAQRWCRENIPAGSLVLRDSYVLPVDKAGVVEKRYRFLTEGVAARKIAAGRFDYLVMSSLAHDRFLDPLSPFFTEDGRQRHLQIIKRYPALAEFRDRKLAFTHPTVTIYSRK